MGPANERWFVMKWFATVAAVAIVAVAIAKKLPFVKDFL